MTSAKSDVAQHEASLAQAISDAQASTFTYYQALITARASATETVQAVLIGKRSFNVALGRYRLGLGSILSVTNAEETLGRLRQRSVATRERLELFPIK